MRNKGARSVEVQTALWFVMPAGCATVALGLGCSDVENQFGPTCFWRRDLAGLGLAWAVE